MRQYLTIPTISNTVTSFSAIRKFALRLVAVTLVLVFCIQNQAEGRAFAEYQLKAVFLYRLSLFITWPKEAFVTSDQSFVIGIVGEDPFGMHMDQVVKNEKVGERPLKVQRYDSVENVLSAPCQILFISQTTGQKWSGLRHQFRRHSILTVSDMTRFGQMGGMVNIQTQDNKLKIEINPYETRKAGLIVSSKLLKVARQVKSDDQETHQ